MTPQQITVRDRRKSKQFSLDNIIIDHYAPIIGSTGHQLYSLYVRMANKEKGEKSWPGFTLISQHLGLNRGTISKYNQLLQILELIHINPGNHIRSNEYFILEPQPLTDERREQIKEAMKAQPKSRDFWGRVFEKLEAWQPMESYWEKHQRQDQVIAILPGGVAVENQGVAVENQGVAVENQGVAVEGLEQSEGTILKNNPNSSSSRERDIDINKNGKGSPSLEDDRGGDILFEEVQSLVPPLSKRKSVENLTSFLNHQNVDLTTWLMFCGWFSSRFETLKDPRPYPNQVENLWSEFLAEVENLDGSELIASLEFSNLSGRARLVVDEAIKFREAKWEAEWNQRFPPDQIEKYSSPGKKESSSSRKLRADDMYAAGSLRTLAIGIGGDPADRGDRTLVITEPGISPGWPDGYSLFEIYRPVVSEQPVRDGKKRYIKHELGQRKLEVLSRSFDLDEILDLAAVHVAKYGGQVNRQRDGGLATPAQLEQLENRFELELPGGLSKADASRMITHLVAEKFLKERGVID